MPIINNYVLNRMTSTMRRIGVVDNFVDMEVIDPKGYTPDTDPFSDMFKQEYQREEIIFATGDTAPVPPGDTFREGESDWTKSVPLEASGSKIWRLKRSLPGDSWAGYYSDESDLPDDLALPRDITDIMKNNTHEAIGLRASNSLFNIAGNEQVSNDRQEHVDEFSFVYIGNEYQPTVEGRIRFIIRQQNLRQLDNVEFRVWKFKEYDNLKTISVRKW